MIEVGGRKVHTLRIEPAQLATPMPCRFETVREQLAEFERMYCEPDGSFVWTSPQDSVAWQVDGNLYDRNEQLLFVDIKGSCPSQQFDRLLSVLGWPQSPIMFQLTQEAVFLDEETFRRYVSVEHPPT